MEDGSLWLVQSLNTASSIAKTSLSRSIKLPNWLVYVKWLTLASLAASRIGEVQRSGMKSPLHSGPMIDFPTVTCMPMKNTPTCGLGFTGFGRSYDFNAASPACQERTLIKAHMRPRSSQTFTPSTHSPRTARTTNIRLYNRAVE